ncbi:hypothetical protein NP233_g11680 [Leucocoprinus birnbaumii]|uniref:Uncharacterized protein n=1 Tax=Leucocoprinus birnbaumii TaxID=56174 RepID=A0AAD5YL36_9AGAR|nr:hypothetical protein NP233_g11680 [Leucocoprinus birnbaumii]
MPILLSILVALMGEMYTTAYDPHKQAREGTADCQFCHNTRFRLQCEGNSIIDFGICFGEIAIREKNALAYFKDIDGPPDPTKEFFPIQDPNEHYWIYFKTFREEFLLDLCAFPFGYPYHICVPTSPYQPDDVEDTLKFPFAPGFFHDRRMRQNQAPLLWESQRHSILQNKALQSIIRNREFSEIDKKILLAFMERVAGRAATEPERYLLLDSTVFNRTALAATLRRKDFLHWPDVPESCGADHNPEEHGSNEYDLPSDEEKEQEARREIKMWSRMARRGELSFQEMEERMKKWYTKKTVSLPPPEQAPVSGDGDAGI